MVSLGLALCVRMGFFHSDLSTAELAGRSNMLNITEGSLTRNRYSSILVLQRLSW
jgi:hypothetical protein